MLGRKPGIDEWDEYFKRAVHLPEPEKTALFLEHFRGRDAIRILDFGCGNGNWGAAFQRDKASYDIGAVTVDVADQHLDKAQNLDAAWVGERFHADFSDITLTPNHYDGIVARNSIMFQPREAMQQSLNKCADALAPDGTLYFTVARHGAAARLRNITCMSRDEIRDAVAQTGLTLVSVELDENATMGPKKDRVPLYHVVAHRCRT